MFEIFQHDFLKQVNKTKKCWLWTGRTNRGGYGIFHISRLGDELAHRLIYSWFTTNLPNSLPIHHKCKNKNCVNPKHLQLLTFSEHKKLHAKKQPNLSLSI